MNWSQHICNNIKRVWKTLYGKEGDRQLGLQAQRKDGKEGYLEVSEGVAKELMGWQNSWTAINTLNPYTSLYLKIVKYIKSRREMYLLEA